MDLVLSLDQLSLPLAEACILASVGLMYVCRGYFCTASVWVSSGMLWAWLCCTPAFAAWLQRELESQYPLQSSASYPKADAIVVLGGGNSPNSGDDWRNNYSITLATRVGFGLALYRDGRAPVILLSGGDGDAERLAKLLRQQGVNKTALQTENTSATTHENALYSAVMLKREKLYSILLVTSAMHMPRAAASFTRQGLKVTAAPAWNIKQQPQQMRQQWRPDSAALYQSDRCLHEYLGLWYYRLRGWA